MEKKIAAEKLLDDETMFKKPQEECKRRKHGSPFLVFILVACFFAQALSLGFYVSFGTIYVELIDIFKTTETTAAWIGSIAMSICFAIGSISSLLIKRFGSGNMISLGGLLLGLGLVLSSLATNITSLALTFSGLMSIGCSFLYFASLSTLPLYFKSGLCIATSAVCSGMNFSGIAFSPMMAYLIKNYGFKTCFQMFSTTAVIPIISGVIIQRFGHVEDVEEGEEKTTNDISYKSLLTNKRLMIVFLAMSLIELCYFIPYVHLVNFGIHHGISLTKASYLPVILSIGGWVGKILFGFIGQIRYLNIIYLFQIFLLAMAVCLTMLPLATTYSHLITFSVIYGIFDGAFTGFIFPVVATTVPAEQVGIAFGTLYTFISIELLFGAPLAGFIYAQTSSYQIPFLLCGGILLLASLIFFGLSGKPDECQPIKKMTECEPIKKMDEEKESNSIFKRLMTKLKSDGGLLHNLSPFSKKVLIVFGLLPRERFVNKTATPLMKQCDSNEEANQNNKKKQVFQPSTNDDICMDEESQTISTIDTSFEDNATCKRQPKSIVRARLQSEDEDTSRDADINNNSIPTCHSSTIVTIMREESRLNETEAIVCHGLERSRIFELAHNLYQLRVFIDGYLSILFKTMLPQRQQMQQNINNNNTTPLCHV